MGVSRLLNSWAMTAEIVPMVASRWDSVSCVRSDSSCCCNSASFSLSESESAVEVGGVVLTQECTPMFFLSALIRRSLHWPNHRKTKTPGEMPPGAYMTIQLDSITLAAATLPAAAFLGRRGVQLLENQAQNRRHQYRYWQDQRLRSHIVRHFRRVILIFQNQPQQTNDEHQRALDTGVHD